MEPVTTGVQGQIRGNGPHIQILFFNVSEGRAVKASPRGGSKIELVSGVHYFVALEPSEVLEVFDDSTGVE